MTFVRAIRPSDALALIVVLVALIVAGIVGAKRAEPPPYVDTYSTHDGDRGGYLGVRRLLDREGVHTIESVRHPRFLEADRLVISAFGTYAAVDIDELHDFVAKRGKTLVVIGQAGRSASRVLHLPQATSAPDVASTYTAVPIVASPLAFNVKRIEGDGRGRIAHAAFPASVPLIADASGAIVVTYTLGRGRVIVVADPTVFSNRLLDHADNARLALDVLAVAPGTVAFDEFVHGYGKPESAWLVLPGPLRFGLIVLAVLCAIALLGSAIRFVPAAAPPIVRDRNSAAYVVSLATLLRRGRATTLALGELIDATFAAIARVFGLPAHTAPHVLAALAGTHAGASERIRELATLRARSAVDEPTLLHAAQLCADLRKDLDTDGTHRRAPAR